MKPENATNMELVTEYTSLMQKLDEENETGSSSPRNWKKCQGNKIQTKQQ